jgi:hypothetical protein
MTIRASGKKGRAVSRKIPGVTLVWSTWSIQKPEAYTFSTSSWGGRGAVTDLGDQITRMRTVHADAVPIVELRAAEMPTKYGRKSKPVFKVCGWKTADKPAPVERQISAAKAKREIDESEMDDEVPF